MALDVGLDLRSFSPAMPGFSWIGLAIILYVAADMIWTGTYQIGCQFVPARICQDGALATFKDASLDVLDPLDVNAEAGRRARRTRRGSDGWCAGLRASPARCRVSARNASGRTRTSAASRAASRTWQMPMPKPALIALSCARSLVGAQARTWARWKNGARFNMLRSAAVS